MELILFIGIQAAGKSEFYKRLFYKSHVRINLDMLRTRHRESIFLNACIEAKQPFVVDNTNPGKKDRQKYIDLAKDNGFKIIGYYFKSSIGDSLARNGNRTGKERVPDSAIKKTHSILELPEYGEGFDELYYVQIKDNDFVVEVFNNEI